MDAILGRLSEPSALEDQVIEGSAGVDLWLNQDLQGFDDDEIGRSILDFTGPDSFEGLTADTFNNVRATNQLQCTSNGPTSCAGGPANSVYCGSDGTQLHRGGALRSYSTNDLELLLETSMSVFPPLIGSIATAAQSTHARAAVGMSARSGLALESVPEGAPSQGGPLPGVSVVDDGSFKSMNAESPGVNRARGIQAPASITPQFPFASVPPPQLPSALQPTSRESSGNLCHVPSSDILSVLTNHTLHLSQESTDDSQQQYLLAAAAGKPQTSYQPAVALTMSPNQQQLEGHSDKAQQPQMKLLEQHLTSSGAGATNLPVTRAASAAEVPAAAAVEGAPDTQCNCTLPQPMDVHESVQVANLAFDSEELNDMAKQHLGSGADGLAAVAASPFGTVPSLRMLQQAHAAAAAGGNPNTTLGWGTAAAAVGESTILQVAGPSSIVAAVSDSRGGGGRLRKVQSALELGAWRSASFSEEQDGAEALAAGPQITGQKMIGRLTPEERLQRILRYRQKRNSRNFHREIKYQCRKTLADSRPRVCGRFARNDDPKSVLPHQSKKAQRMKFAGNSQQIGIKMEPSVGGQLATTGSLGQQLDSGSIQQQSAVWQQLSRSASLQAALSAHIALAPPAASAGSNSTTTSSGIGEGAGSFSAGTAAAAIAIANPGMSTQPPYTAGPPPSCSISAAAPTGCAQSCVMSSPSAGMVFPYVLSSLPHLPMSVSVPLAAGLPLLSVAAWDPSQLQHHYQVVNTAAQAGAHGVYAHLAHISNAGPHAPVPAGPTLLPLYPAMPQQQPQQDKLANGCTYGNKPTIHSVGLSFGRIMPVDASCGPAPEPSDVPPRLDTPIPDPMLVHMDAELQGAAAHAAPVSALAGAEQANGVNVTCMTVDS